MLVFCWVARGIRCSKLDQPEKLFLKSKKLWILLKPRTYSSFWAIIFEWSDFELLDVADNVRGIGPLSVIIPYSSLAPNAEFYVICVFIVHSTKLLNSDWSRAVQLIPNSTRQEYLLSFHGNSAWEQANVANLNLLIGETGRKGT